MLNSVAEDVVDPTNRTHAFLIGRHHKKLNAAEVRFVATLVAGGDVADCVGAPSGEVVDRARTQDTITYLKLPPEKESLQWRHHRIVVREIGKPLKEYGDSLELVMSVSRVVLLDVAEAL